MTERENTVHPDSGEGMTEREKQEIIMQLKALEGIKRNLLKLLASSTYTEIESVSIKVVIPSTK